MTDKQRKHWTFKARELERRLIDHYRRWPLLASEMPDGSFVMSLAIQIFEAGFRKAKKAAK